MNKRGQLGFGGFLLRLLFALTLVFATYNPSGYSYVDWVRSALETPIVYKVISGVVLAIGWVIYLRATKNSLGVFGIILSLALLGCIVWLFIEWRVFEASNRTAMTWAAQGVVAALLAIGMSWSHIRRRLSGQYDTDEIE